jgi:hypothetical protein
MRRRAKTRLKEFLLSREPASMLAEQLSPCRIKRNHRRRRRIASGRAVYAYVGGNPLSYIDPLGLSGATGSWGGSGATGSWSSQSDLGSGIALANKYLCKAGGNIEAADDQIMKDRISRNWEALTPEGQDLRTADHYLFAATMVDTYGDSWYAQTFSWTGTALAVPLWQGWDLAQNAVGKKSWSPASSTSLEAGWQGAWDRVHNNVGNPSASGCGCH